MTSRSLKRRRTTRQSISIATSPIVFGLLIATFGVVLSAERAHAGKTLHWGSAEAKATNHSTQTDGAVRSVIIRDSQVIAAAWDEADAAVSADRQLDPIRVAQRRSVVVNRGPQAEDAVTNSGNGNLSDERFAKLPTDPFEDDSIEQFTPSVGTETEPSQYDLFNEPVDLYGSSQEADGLVADMPAVSEQADDLEMAETDAIDLWQTSQEITPTREADVAPRTDSDSHGIFEILTQGDTDSSDLEERYQHQVEELQREIIGDDPNDWLNMELMQPDKEELSRLQREILEAEREENKKSCHEEIEKLRAQKVENIDLSIRLEGSAGQDFPFECTLEDQQPEPRDWSQITYMWKASGLCHKPLYFEQVHLERYGHSWGPIAQPLLSGVHFFGTIPILPYKMGLKIPNECVYTLGHYRPGDCAPYMIDPIPFTWRAAGYQAGFATGLSFILP